MELVIETWNSIAVNDSNPYASTFPPGQRVNLTSQGISVPRANLFPYLSGRVLKEHFVQIRVIIAGQNDIPTYRELLKAIFDVTDNSPHNLITKDIADSDRQWYLRGFPVSIQEQQAGLYFVRLQLETPIWQLVTPGTDTWNISTDSDTESITNIGTVYVPPVFEITPTVSKTGGLSKGIWIPVYNPMSSPFTQPLEITDGGLDTAALVAGGFMQASGNDFLVWQDGNFVDRWLDAMDSASTRCWINVNLPPIQSAVLGANIAGAGSISTITLASTRASKSFLIAMNKVINQVVYFGSEAFLFTGVDLFTYQLTGVTRAAKGTSDTVHTAGDVVYWMPTDLWILYDDPTLGAPDISDTLKPMCDLSSDNNLLSFTNYFEQARTRPFSWQGEVNSTKTNVSYTFTGFENTQANPSVELGLALSNLPDVTIIQQETGQLDWLFSHPCGMTNVSYAGEKYTIRTSWPSIVGLQILVDGAAWQTVQNEAIPIAPAFWDTISQSVSLGGTYGSVRFAIDGTLSLTAGDIAMAQFNTVILTIDSSNLPILVLTTAQAINFFNFTLTNNTTGDALVVNAPCPLNVTMTIDCEGKVLSMSNGDRFSIQLSTDRTDWLDLDPGANTLQWDDVGTNGVTIVTTHRDRTL